MSRAQLISDVIEEHVIVYPDDTVRNAKAVAEMIVDRLDADDAPLSEREKSLMIALWWVVKASGGKVRVTKLTADKMVFGVDKIEQTPDPHGNLTIRCVR